MDCIQHLCKIRPIAALFECSDGLHQLTGNHRTRWLAVWCRSDIVGEKTRERILCSAQRRMPWNDPQHRFALPFELVQALQLNEQQHDVYGDRLLLPPAKQARLSEDALREDVLQQRLVQGNDYLPTLCASYAAQHILQQNHVETKGIFASILYEQGHFHFLDPFPFASLFGTTATLVLPSDLRTAFHQLGNAISQLHGLVATLFALEQVSANSYPKLVLLQQCWDDRLTSSNAIVRHCDDTYVLQPIADLAGKYCDLATMVGW